MEMEKEITVKLSCNYETLDKDLKNKGFRISEEYQLNDVYMIPIDVDITQIDKLELLKKCILVRDVVDIAKYIVYKYKKYNDNGDILEQGKVKCKIDNVEEAIKLLEVIGYRVLFKIYDKIIEYNNDKIRFATQQVNDKYLFIEMEDDNVLKNYDSIEEMISDFEQYNLDYDKSNYFVKKALIVLNDTLNEV